MLMQQRFSYTVDKTVWCISSHDSGKRRHLRFLFLSGALKDQVVHEQFCVSHRFVKFVGYDVTYISNCEDTDDMVCYAVDSFPGHGYLSGQKLDENQAGEHVDTHKLSADFALWKVHALAW
jgi:cysteinyl-tRNA synthetase